MTSQGSGPSVLAPANAVGPGHPAEPSAGRRQSALRVRPRPAAVLAVASLAGLAMFCWPLLVKPPEGLAHQTDAPFIFVLILPLVLAVILAELHAPGAPARSGGPPGPARAGGMDIKALAMLGVLAAVGAALRPLGAGLAGIEPMFFLLVLGGRAYGPGFGFVLGSTTMFASALLTGGVGPWLPFQMLAASWMGMGAGLLPRASGKTEIAMLAAYGAVSSIAYGALLNLWFWPFSVGLSTDVSYIPGAPVLENLHRFLTFTFYTSVLGWDVGRAVITTVAIVVLGSPVLFALRRAIRKAAFDAPVAFGLGEGG